MPRSCLVVKKELDDLAKIAPSFLRHGTLQPMARIARRWTRKAHVTGFALGMAAMTVLPRRAPLSHDGRVSCRKWGIFAGAKIRIAARNGSMLALLREMSIAEVLRQSCCRA
jgi:hypothetical protein